MGTSAGVPRAAREGAGGLGGDRRVVVLDERGHARDASRGSPRRESSATAARRRSGSASSRVSRSGFSATRPAATTPAKIGPHSSTGTRFTERAPRLDGTREAGHQRHGRLGPAGDEPGDELPAVVRVAVARGQRLDERREVLGPSAGERLSGADHLVLAEVHVDREAQGLRLGAGRLDDAPVLAGRWTACGASSGDTGAGWGAPAGAARRGLRFRRRLRRPRRLRLRPGLRLGAAPAGRAPLLLPGPRRSFVRGSSGPATSASAPSSGKSSPR